MGITTWIYTDYPPPKPPLPPTTLLQVDDGLDGVDEGLTLRRFVTIKCQQLAQLPPPLENLLGQLGFPNPLGNAPTPPYQRVDTHPQKRLSYTSWDGGDRDKDIQILIGQ